MTICRGAPLGLGAVLVGLMIAVLPLVSEAQSPKRGGTLHVSYGNDTISGSPFYMVVQPHVKGYVYNAEFEVHWDTVWLDK